MDQSCLTNFTAASSFWKSKTASILDFAILHLNDFYFYWLVNLCKFLLPTPTLYHYFSFLISLSTIQSMSVHLDTREPTSMSYSLSWFTREVQRAVTTTPTSSLSPLATGSASTTSKWTTSHLMTSGKLTAVLLGEDTTPQHIPGFTLVIFISFLPQGSVYLNVTLFFEYP